MITVNLLPHHLRPIKRTPLPHIASVGLLVAAIIAMMLMYFAVRRDIADARTEKEARRAEFSRVTDIKDEKGEPITLADVVQEYNELSEQKLELEATVDVIKTILSDRIIWSKQLHKLAALTPDNIWYSRIRVITQTFRDTRMKRDPATGKLVINPRTEEPEMETVTERKRILEISGYVVADEQGESKIYPLTERTTDPDERYDFTERFTLLRPRVEDAEFGGYQVRSFTLEYEVKRNLEAEEGEG